jgi:molybdopterin-containing oxidoreductase family membrane subunit
VVSLVLLLNPKTRRNDATLAVACVATFVSLWLEKGLGLIVAGFVPGPLEHVTDYAPTIPELFIGIGIWALGFLVLTVLYKIAVSVKQASAGA